MADTKQGIINAIKEHIQKEGGIDSSWYVGISKDARNRLFNDHNVSEKDAWWIFRQASSSQVAREVEDYFVNTLYTDGGTGGGDDSANMVYAYKKASGTKE
jgi:hypothetical protein